ncbi:MAG: ATP phosphoribosyltransferase regulatory subunit, partial [Candidatus Nitrotoga sp.]
RARAATGFSMDLRQLHALLPPQKQPMGILAPHLDDPALQAEIVRLRSLGYAVVVDLLGDRSLRAELNCDRELVLQAKDVWKVVALHS